MQVDPKHCLIVIKINVNSCSISYKEGRSYIKHLCCWPEVFICISVCAFVAVLCRCRSVSFLIPWYKCIPQNWCLALALSYQNVGILCCTDVWLLWVMYSSLNCSEIWLHFWLCYLSAIMCMCWFCVYFCIWSYNFYAVFENSGNMYLYIE